MAPVCRLGRKATVCQRAAGSCEPGRRSGVLRCGSCIMQCMRSALHPMKSAAFAIRSAALGVKISLPKRTVPATSKNDILDFFCLCVCHGQHLNGRVATAHPSLSGPIASVSSSSSAGLPSADCARCDVGTITPGANGFSACVHLVPGGSSQQVARQQG